jgi:tRNA(His) guanylyltransferase
MIDELGVRMKEQYENRTRYFVPRRTYTIVRVDGKAFHTFCHLFGKPYDMNLVSGINFAAMKLCKETQGISFAFIQSDEISVLLTDFEKETTDAWFDGNIQKIASISASIVTAAFNNWIGSNVEEVRTAYFDSRVFTIPDPTEVENYFIWRQKDAERNSLNMVAQMHYSHSRLEGKSFQERHNMIHEKGDNWDSYPDWFKRGRVCSYVELSKTWEINSVPIFTADREWLRSRIPKYP